MSGKIRVQVVVPNTGSIDTQLMLYLFNLIYDGRYDLHYAFPMYHPISHARNKIVREFLESAVPFDYLLMIDSDVVPSRNPLDLIEYDQDVVAQICPIWKGDRAPGHEVMWNLEPLGQIALGEGLLEVKAAGAGCLLIARRVLAAEAMRGPFVEVADADGLLTRSEDLAFCDRARAAGFRVWADLAGKCSHNKEIDLRQVGNAILIRREQPILSPRQALGDKRLIFALSPGRCSTRWLAEVFGSVRGVASFHEPEPNFARVMRAVQDDPRLAYPFWLEEKLPAIAAAPADVYVETSHIFGKGFVKALLDVGVVPDVVSIRREPREVAASYWRRNAIPGRTAAGRRWLVQPDDRGVYAPLDDWQTLSDYQLCLWYALEQQIRAELLGERIRRAGGQVIALDFETMIQVKVFERLLFQLGLVERWDRERFEELNQVYNANSPEIAARVLPPDADEQADALYVRLRENGLIWD